MHKSAARFNGLALLAGVLGSLYLQGCVAAETSQPSQARVSLIPTDSACPAGKIAPLLIALAPVLIKSGLGFLKDLAADKAASYEATTSGSTSELFVSNCVAVEGAPVAGSGPPPVRRLVRFKSLTFGYGPIRTSKSPTLSDDKRYQTLGFTGKPKFYFEAEIEQQGPYIRLLPKSLEFNENLARSGNDKDLLVTLSFNFPTANLVALGSSTDQRMPNAADTEAGASDKKPKKLENAANPAGHKAPNPSGKAPATSPLADGGAAAKENAAPKTSAAGSTQTIVLPVFEHVAKGTILDLSGTAAGWIVLPDENPELKKSLSDGDASLPVTVTVTVKTTDGGHGSEAWLRVSQDIADNTESIASALLPSKSSKSEGASGGSK